MARKSYATSFVLFLLLLGLACPAFAAPAGNNLLIYCGITMVRPITDIARQFEKQEKISIAIAQGGSEDLYQSAKKSQKGDLYLPGEPVFRIKHQPEGLLGEYKVLGMNQMALMVKKGNPKKVKPDLKELLRKDLAVVLGSSESGSVGVEAHRILTQTGLYPKVAAKVVQMLPDSRSIMAAMRRGDADLTMSWRATGYFPDNAPSIDVLDLPPSIAPPQELQLTLLTFSKNQAMARKFMEYAAGPQGQSIFRRYGFITVSKAGR
ncbi:molybdate transport system substrate-binding protein [Trichlorobacter thiogenes]|uniref:Molybdate transport system substrate-binding protein n=1 Tax=Trichlorobacter thiogenes TaxID=115783 RepID=A0A1T4QFF7_9BACT|nr:molybdate ABC transporter substrate-binding protein [Trichlorobacter thiogenes]SKA02462.1 molybdate transport system substrate-binding protein [Trichlorobacter thiogenes]